MGSNANHQKMEAASSVQEKDKMAEGSGFAFSLPFANLLILEGQGWVFSDNNYGSGTKMISLCEVEKN